MFAVKTEILKELFSDAKWASKLNNAKSVEEIAEILTRFCKAKGFSVTTVCLPQRREKSGEA